MSHVGTRGENWSSNLSMRKLILTLTTEKVRSTVLKMPSRPPGSLFDCMYRLASAPRGCRCAVNAAVIGQPAAPAGPPATLRRPQGQGDWDDLCAKSSSEVVPANAAAGAATACRGRGPGAPWCHSILAAHRAVSGVTAASHKQSRPTARRGISSMPVLVTVVTVRSHEPSCGANFDMTGGKWTPTTAAAGRDYGSGEEVGAVTPRASFRKVKGLMDGTSLPQLAFYTLAATLMVFGVMAAQGTQGCRAP